MPEMPEVETIARKLRRALIGKRIAAVELSGLPLRRPIADSFAFDLPGRTVSKIRRRGKYLVIRLEPRLFWLVHLGMSGRIHYGAGAAVPQAHTHAVVRFSDGSELHYRDHRRFGLLAAYDVARPAEIPELRALGADPLGARFTARWLSAELRRRRTEIKSFLLDQRRIAGLGNIYACEALFRARIHPARRCHRITAVEAARLVAAVRAVLQAAVRRRGTTFSDFMDSDGEPGDNQNFLRVFQREGRRCRRCRTPIERLRQGNRSSFLCPRCQRAGVAGSVRGGV
ncbi:MAG: formamidopyrimidine-DNA glycosylase [Acidobacteria bacterium]|nr:MAG: formamidopyrimidine-DNA glycosylase [Acidobacteriota bacterium]